MHLFLWSYEFHTNLMENLNTHFTHCQYLHAANIVLYLTPEVPPGHSNWRKVSVASSTPVNMVPHWVAEEGSQFSVTPKLRVERRNYRLYRVAKIQNHSIFFSLQKNSFVQDRYPGEPLPLEGLRLPVVPRRVDPDGGHLPGDGGAGVDQEPE